MKYFFLFFFLAINFSPKTAEAFGYNVDKAPADTAVSTEVTLYSNAYAYPKIDAENNWRQISNKGLSHWDNANTFTRTFFYPQITGQIMVGVKLRSPDGDCKLTIQLDNDGKKYNLAINKSSDFTIVPVGFFEIKDVKYHFIEIRGVSKTGANFPDIESLVFSGPAAKDLKYNLSNYRGAVSTHIWYQYPKDEPIAWFYNEVTIPPGVNATNAYYMTNGFSDGYMGIQLNSATERRFIFSVWSNYNTNNPKEIPSDYAITLVKKGTDVFSGEFGNEGSGGHSHLVFDWKQGNTYKMLLGAKPVGDHTIYTAYYFAPEINKWKLIAQWDKTKTGGKLLSGLYSFVENFGANGDDFFKADYGNQWVCTSSGKWIELTRCKLTSTAGPAKHQRYDYGAGVENNKFYMFTGGFKELNDNTFNATYERMANKIAPVIDFSELPNQ